MANKQSNRGWAAFKVTVNGEEVKAAFQCKTSIYTSLKDELGLDLVQEAFPEGYIEFKISGLVSNGLVMVMKVMGKMGTVSKSGTLVCPIDKVVTATTKLKGAKYGGWNISRAYQSGDRRVSY